MKPRSVLALALLVAACARAQKRADPAPFQVEGDRLVFNDAAAQAASVVVQKIGFAGDAHVSVTGRLVWDEDATARVFPPVSGRVSRIAVDLGASVKKGDLLAALASPDFGQAQAEAARAAAERNAAERALERVRQLEERGAAARKDLEQAEAEAERARAEAERTGRRLRLWGGDGAEPGRVDQEFRVVTPVPGVVVERNLNPGQEVRSDTAAPLFVISDPRRLWVLLDVTEKDLPDVARGAALQIRSPAFPDRSFPGTLEVVGAALDPATRTVRARGRLDDHEAVLKAEMYVTVEILKAAARRHLVLPARAVIQEGRQQFVFVEESPGRYRRVPVTVGMEREGLVPVLSGLADSARVVTEGSLLLEAAWAEGHPS